MASASGRFCFVSLCLVILISTLASASTFVFQPSTTLTQETANNTSAADSFAGQTNGNAAAGNVSKQPIRSLLYADSTTQIYAHFMPWFGQPNHINVGYSSDDPVQAKKQVDDMVSRGIQGVIIDWYGPNAAMENNSSIVMMNEVQSRQGFTFAIMEDAGALTKCANTAGCDITQRLIDDLNYSNFTFQSSPAYLQYNGRPVVFFFGVDAYALDWDRVRANVNGNPLFIFRNNSGFTHKQTDGAFSWIQPNASNPDDEGLTYLDSFYTAAKNYPGEQTFGSTYSGFNNSLAPWLGSTAPKIMNQHCGQTWLDSFARIGQKYSSSSQLASIQLVTWNDYEEGTELESGIDNCVTVTGAVSGSNFTWSNTGQENTIDHYTVFISEDGEQLMSLGDVPAGTHSKSLSGLGLDPSKTYTLYVKAVGKPTLHNQISAAVTYAVANQPPTAVLSVSPASGTAPLTVTASTANSTDSDGSIVSSSINFGDGTIVAGPSASHIYNNPGTYTVTATVTDNANASSTATSAVTVSSTCKINSTDRTITICAPTNNQTVPSPVRVLAYATDSRSVSNMKIYIDGATVYTKGSTKKVDTYINVAKGIRKLKVSATDSSGTFAKTYTITVP